MVFDPKKYGAIPVNKFDPSKYGGTPVKTDTKDVRASLVKPKSAKEKITDFFSKTVPDFGVGAAKGAVKTIKGAADLGQKIFDPITDVLTGSEAPDGQNTDIIPKEAYTPKNAAEKAGMAVEQIAEYAIPATKVSKATQAMKFIPKVATRAASGAGVASVQAGDVGKEAAIAAAAETAIPVVGAAIKPVVNVVGRLLKGLGSGISGLGTEGIEQIIKDPKVASQVSKEIATKGNAAVLEKNAKDIVEGVSSIRQQARAAYGKGLEQLAKTDIEPKTFRSTIQSFLDKAGSVVEKKTGQRILQNIEFDDPKNIQKASSLIDRLSKTDLDGVSLRKLTDDIESAAYKTATSDERLAFNVFIKDLSGAVKNAITKSTDKLDEINAAFSEDIQLVEAIQNIFGKVKFKNLAEINKVSQQLETLFSKKGLSPEYIDDFLARAGIGDGLKTSEAVRQITNKAVGNNELGLSLSELTRQVTSSVITPNLIKNIAIFTGKSSQAISNILPQISPSARAAFIKLITPKEKLIEEGVDGGGEIQE